MHVDWYRLLLLRDDTASFPGNITPIPTDNGRLPHPRKKGHETSKNPKELYSITADYGDYDNFHISGFAMDGYGKLAACFIHQAVTGEGKPFLGAAGIRILKQHKPLLLGACGFETLFVLVGVRAARPLQKGTSAIGWMARSGSSQNWECVWSGEKRKPRSHGSVPDLLLPSRPVRGGKMKLDLFGEDLCISTLRWLVVPIWGYGCGKAYSEDFGWVALGNNASR